MFFLRSISSSSSAANSADHMRDETPTTIESMKAATPRMIGTFSIPLIGITLLYGSVFTSISWSALRTATA